MGSIADMLIQAIQNPESMNSMSNGDLMMLRNYTSSPSMQRVIAPYEHQAFAREITAENPVNAIGLSLMIPAYQASKALGLRDGRSGVSMGQVVAGYKGVGQGLKQWFDDSF